MHIIHNSKRSLNGYLLQEYADGGWVDITWHTHQNPQVEFQDANSIYVEC